MTRLTTAALLAGATMLGACAQSPDSILPVSMGNAFVEMPCGQARQMLAAERQTLAALEVRQNDAVAGDALGVFLVGVPMSSLSGGDAAGEIAAAKGKVIALENRLLTCA